MMQTMLVILLICMVCLLSQVTAYGTRLTQRARAYRMDSRLFSFAGAMKENDMQWINELMENIFRALPEVLTPSKEMEKEKVIPNPPKFVKADTAGHFKSQRGYHYDDLVKSFNDKYVSLNLKQKASNVQHHPGQLLPLLIELHEAGLEEKLEKELTNLYSTEDKNPLVSPPSYIYEALEVSMAPLKTKLDQEKVVHEPLRLRKPLKLSELRKVLASNPDYYKM